MWSPLMTTMRVIPTYDIACQYGRNLAAIDLESVESMSDQNEPESEVYTETAIGEEAGVSLL